MRKLLRILTRLGKGRFSLQRMFVVFEHPHPELFPAHRTEYWLTRVKRSQRQDRSYLTLNKVFEGVTD